MKQNRVLSWAAANAFGLGVGFVGILQTSMLLGVAALVSGASLFRALPQARAEDPRRVGSPGALLVALVLACGSGAAEAASAPPVVSPGEESAGAPAPPCPTFTWGAVEAARGYEVVVYRITEGTVGAQPALSERVPGGAVAWTPALDRCLAAGGRYAWSVRAETAEGPTDWGPPRFFQVVAGRPAGGLTESADAVRGTVTDRSGREGASAARPGAPSAMRSPVERAVSEGGREDGATGGSRPEGAPPRSIAAAAVGNPAAALTVRGEVRTVDGDGLPRLWGRGRFGTTVYPQAITGNYCINFEHGGVQYGLSRTLVDWGSAEDACPAGTWVCPAHIVDSCNTSRPDTGNDGYGCDGSSLNYVENAHYGWTMGAVPTAAGAGAVYSRSEDGNAVARLACTLLPVWCCF